MTLFRFRSLVWFCIGITSLLAAFGMSSRAPWFQTAFFASFGVMTFSLKRRILRVGVRRSESGIECRYVPWFESVSYMVFVLFPVFAVCFYAAGSRPGAQAAYRWGAGAVLIAALVALIYSMWMWRTSVLRLTPLSLTLRLPSLPSESI
jgi:protein-S-isoprenylcysteine O-methyltransferase Ste14